MRYPRSACSLAVLVTAAAVCPDVAHAEEAPVLMIMVDSATSDPRLRDGSPPVDAGKPLTIIVEGAGASSCESGVLTLRGADGRVVDEVSNNRKPLKWSLEANALSGKKAVVTLTCSGKTRKGVPVHQAGAAPPDSASPPTPVKGEPEPAEPAAQFLFAACLDGQSKGTKALIDAVKDQKYDGDAGPLPVCPLPSDETFRGGTPDKLLADTLGTAAADLVQILVEIAIDRARSKGFELVRSMVVEHVCDAKVKLRHDGAIHEVFPRTCELVKSVRLEALASQATPLSAAFTSDVIDFVMEALNEAIKPPKGVNKDPLMPAVRALASQLRLSVEGGKVRVLLPEPKSFLDVLASTKWEHTGDKMTTWSNALRIARVCLAQNTLRECPIGDLIHAAGKMNSAEVAPLAELMVLAARPNEYRTREERFRLAIEVLAWLMESHNVDAATRRQVRQFFIAMIDRDLASMLSVSTSILTSIEWNPPGNEACGDSSWTVKDGDDCVLSDKARRGLRVLSTLAAFAATYVDVKKPDGSDSEAAKKQQEEVHAARKKLIEGLVQEMTDREGRDLDAIFSLGTNVSIVTGGQAIREASDEYKWSAMSPQASLPLGIAADVPLYKHFGLHFMLYPIDVAQFAAYSTKEGITRPRWDTMLTVGGQVGVMFGHSTPITLTFDARYSPTLFAGSGGASLDAERGGAWRLGASLGYYVPFIDFN